VPSAPRDVLHPAADQASAVSFQKRHSMTVSHSAAASSSRGAPMQGRRAAVVLGGGSELAVCGNASEGAGDNGGGGANASGGGGDNGGGGGAQPMVRPSLKPCRRKWQRTASSWAALHAG